MLYHALTVSLWCLDNPSALCLSVFATYSQKSESCIRKVSSHANSLISFTTAYFTSRLMRGTQDYIFEEHSWDEGNWCGTVRKLEHSSDAMIFSSLCDKVVMPVASYQWSLMAWDLHHTVRNYWNWIVRVRWREVSVEVKDVIWE